MAIIGKLASLSHLFEKTQEMEALYIYLNNAINPNHSIHKRIINTPMHAENKIKLEAGMYAIEQSYILKNSNKAFYESHQYYIDFQLCVLGVEIFHLGDKNDFIIKTPYDEKKDLITYKKSCCISKIRLSEGMLGIFFENDIHAGGLKSGNIEGNIFKTVVKVPKKLVKLKL
ncbi:YhcH/YjgK/YiaL family protein [Helicobacter sp. 13S00477-4]|uniref:YhcH/YjgK/YiaL family protein n=1 Tax=Helicobacter sp. 13S00477-4 TaxID=1905759 RepID=UPI000BA5965A|nr:YhcH/YjgK/YiaL family protein [Helicobacter sp. 13S00477-4]PAF52681.1 hypothetical protein BKH44_00410 [Helicobacter sp. 13S00477-4]